MKRTTLSAISAVAAFAATLGIQGAHARRDTSPPPATPAGKARSCIPLQQIRNTSVHGDSVIDFHMSGGKVYRNMLPYQCSGLGFEEKFSYKTSLSQLCSTDIITVLRSPPSMQGPSCGLGEFQPVTLAKKR